MALQCLRVSEREIEQKVESAWWLPEHRFCHRISGAQNIYNSYTAAAADPRIVLFCPFVLRGSRYSRLADAED